MLKNNGMKPVPTTINNPTANSINERMHQRMGNQLRSILHSRETPRNFEQAARIVVTYLQNNPTSLHKDEVVLTMHAFKNKYPCK